MSASVQTQDSPAFFVLEPTSPLVPLVVASPHSGQGYSADFLAASRLELPALRRSEDSFVDELFRSAPSIGAPLLGARFPRAFCDVNRERWELDPDMFAEPLPGFCNVNSRRVAAGFGTIARVVANGASIYRRKLTWDEARLRIETCWEPYHAALAALIGQACDRFGHCLLIDCHSMPEEPTPRTRPQAGFVIGDAFGTSCSPDIVRAVEQELAATGRLVRRNDPYAGGYVTRHYGHPREGVHVLQLEIARRLYMDEQRHCKLEGFEILRAQLHRMMESAVRASPVRP